MVLGAYSGEQAFVWLENMRVGADIFQKLATGIALIIGGIFAWHKFIRRGEHDPRLQPTVTDKITTDKEMIYVVATATVRNTGNIDVDLNLENCLLEAYTTTAEGDHWEFSVDDDVFMEHSHVQVGETIEDQVLLEIPRGEEIFVRLDLTVSNEREDEENDLWFTTDIVPISPIGGGKTSSDG